MTWWHYLLLANVYLTLFFVFYTLFLRKETFFNLNRVYLVSAAMLSFFIPVIQSAWIKNLFITQKVQETIYHVGPVVMYEFNATASQARQVTLGEILGGVYLVGILVLTIRFIYQLAVINWAINQSGTETTYSFFNQIKVEEHDADNAIITAHEQVHVRQWHSADVLLMEAIMIINWFNPVVYLYRTAVKHIHEFIADRDALKAGADKADYAMLLLSQTFTAPPYHLVTPFFNSSLLKQRILMLQKNQSQRIMLIKYGLSAPLFALMLVLSSATVNNSKTIKVINHKAQEVFLTPADFSDGAGANSGEITQQTAVEYPSPDSLSEQDRRDLYAVIRQHSMPPANTLSGHPLNSAKTPVINAKIDANQNAIFTAVEHSAEFPGGADAFYRYVSNNIHYPDEARQKNIQGKVYATFVVEKNGDITDVRVLRGIGGGADDETVKLLSNMPKWQPGIQNGYAIRQQYTVPINFTLTDDSKSDNLTAPGKKAQQTSTDADVRTDDPAGNQNTDEESAVFTAVEHSAEFPGGIDRFYSFLATTLRYPAAARQKNIQGRVYLTFVVEKDGSLSHMHIIREPGAGLGEEALRVMGLSPKWVPGVQNGHTVRQQYTVPISFTLGSNKMSANRGVMDQEQILASNAAASHPQL